MQQGPCRVAAMIENVTAWKCGAYFTCSYSNTQRWSNVKGISTRSVLALVSSGSI